MVPTSSAYRKAVNGDQRRIKPKVLVYFDGDDQPPVEFEDEVISIKFLEEASAESGTPLGAVSSNELVLSLDNSERLFTPTNTDSIYYGKIKPNTLIRAYLGLETTTDVFEFIPLGVFRTGDWSAPSGDVEATVTCYDRLYELGKKDVPMLPIVADTTIYAMFDMLFKALGLREDEYEIDTSLNQKIIFGWLPKGKVRDALQTLAIAGNCNVVSNRYGQIAVRSNYAGGEPVTTLTDDDQIITAENPQRYLDIYSVVKIAYKLPYLKESSSLLKIESVVIPHGGTTLRDLEFSDPVYSVDQVRLLGAQNSRVTGLEYGTWGINIEIANPGHDETVAIEVVGRVVETTTSSCTVRDKQAVAQVGDKELTIDNYLIQDQVTARRYAASLLNLLKNPLSKYTATIRGNPALEAGDVVELVSEATKLGTASVMLSRISMTYDGGLEADIDCTLRLVPMEWVFVSPGLAALVPKKY